MLRRSFLKRMAFAAVACAFFDVPLTEEQPNLIVRVDFPSGEWVQIEHLIQNAKLDLDPTTLPDGVTISFEEELLPDGGPITRRWSRSRTSRQPHLTHAV